MYDSILIPTDGSEGTEEAVEHGLDIAEKYGATVHVLYVVDTSSLYLGEGGYQEVLEEFHNLGKVSTVEIAEMAESKGIDVVKEIREGKPHEEILRYADDADVDLIVMGTHGRHGIGRILMGSVAERVVRTADVPVLTARLKSTEVQDPETAREIARHALLEEGHYDVSFEGDPYRESGTWIVPAVSTDDGEFNVHIDVETRKTRVAKIS